MKNKKTALVIEGGGQRGVFSFGITDTFINNHLSVYKAPGKSIITISIITNNPFFE